MTTHFCVNLKKEINELKLTKDNYVSVNDKSSINKGVVYSEEWCMAHQKKCLDNFKLNMSYFASLDKNKFDSTVDTFVDDFKFAEVRNLNDYMDEEGYYLMILDEYKQAYIGISGNIKRRIMQHWSKTKAFDRLIFGSVENSIISIDSFRALDTTRIFVLIKNDISEKENEYIEKFSSQYLLNRTIGGKLSGFGEAISSGKIRNLI